MERGSQIIDDVRTWANEHSSHFPSPAARQAGAALTAIHHDMPEVVGLCANLLGQMDVEVGHSRTISRRLADATTRELIVAGDAPLTNTERYDVVRRSMRSVLVQEAAGLELTRRGGIDPVRALDREPDTKGFGMRAEGALRRSGVDARDLFDNMTEHDLKRTSQGAYHHLSVIAQDALGRAIEGTRTTTAEQTQMNLEIKPQHDTTAFANHPLRHRAPRPEAAVTGFGRRQSMQHAASIAASMAASM